MADIPVNTDNGSIEIEINLRTARDGNQALKEAAEKAQAQARPQGRKLASGYGTRRDGDVLTVIFPLQEQP